MKFTQQALKNDLADLAQFLGADSGAVVSNSAELQTEMDAGTKAIFLLAGPDYVVLDNRYDNWDMPDGFQMIGEKLPTTPDNSSDDGVRIICSSVNETIFTMPITTETLALETTGSDTVGPIYPAASPANLSAPATIPSGTMVQFSMAATEFSNTQTLTCITDKDLIAAVNISVLQSFGFDTILKDGGNVQVWRGAVKRNLRFENINFASPFDMAGVIGLKFKKCIFAAGAIYDTDFGMNWEFTGCSNATSNMQPMFISYIRWDGMGDGSNYVEQRNVFISHGYNVQLANATPGTNHWEIFLDLNTNVSVENCASYDLDFNHSANVSADGVNSTAIYVRAARNITLTGCSGLPLESHSAESISFIGHKFDVGDTNPFGFSDVNNYGNPLAEADFADTIYDLSNERLVKRQSTFINTSLQGRRWLINDANAISGGITYCCWGHDGWIDLNILTEDTTVLLRAGLETRNNRIVIQDVANLPARSKILEAETIGAVTPTIDGQASYTMSDGEIIVLRWDGTNWIKEN